MISNDLRPTRYCLIWQRYGNHSRDSMNGSCDHEVAIFTEALQLPAGERAAYLERVCGSDLELRRKVEILLEAHTQVGDFLEEPPES